MQGAKGVANPLVDLSMAVAKGEPARIGVETSGEINSRGFRRNYAQPPVIDAERIFVKRQEHRGS